MGRPEVLIDGIAFENNSQIGIWRLFYEVMSRTKSNVQYTLLVSKKPIQSVPQGVTVRRIGPRYNPISRKQIHLRLLNWPLERMLQAKYPDAIWHSTFYGTDPRKGARKVVTVFDMMAEKQYAIGPYVEQRERKLRSLNDVDSILTISNSSAVDLCRFYPLLKDKVRVMHLGGDHLNRLSIEKENGGHERLHESVRGQEFCLFVGGRYAYKNFGCVVEALALPTWPRDLRMVIVGPPFDDAEQAFINAMGIAQRIVHVGKVSDDLLEWYYRLAKCFIFPSLMEGFGIPILEAQALGAVPVISDTPVFHEVAGDGAIFFKPSSPNELVSAVESAQVDEVRVQIIQAAENNLSRFSWDKAASITMECYEELWAKNLNNRTTSVTTGSQ